MADLSESIEIAAPASLVYAMLSDLRRMGEWSPENRGARWLGRSPSPGADTPVGSRFIGFNRHRWLVWPTYGWVTVAEPGRAFSFEVVFLLFRVALWEYRLTPGTDNGSGTAGGPGGDRVTVTESWTDRRSPRMDRLMTLIFRTPRVQLNTDGIRHTLAQLKTAAEASANEGPR